MHGVRFQSRTKQKGAITMTENEAIKILGNTTLCSPLGQAAFRAIESIKELQQFREIGTVEECRKAYWLEEVE